MNRLQILTLCFCSLVITLISCSHRHDDIYGKWELPTAYPPGGGQSTEIFEFNKNGILTITSSSVREESIVECTITCDYTYEDNTIKYRISPENISYTKLEGFSQEQIDFMKGFNRGRLCNSEMILDNVKIEGNKLKANIGNGQITFKRLD